MIVHFSIESKSEYSLSISILYLSIYKFFDRTPHPQIFFSRSVPGHINHFETYNFLIYNATRIIEFMLFYLLLFLNYATDGVFLLS